jgi:SAM-dependent methyltransferase
VTAVDLLEPAPELRQQYPSIQWLTADAAALPLEDQSVDLVFTQCAWLWFAEPARVLKEIQRVLRPSGSLACIEPDYAGMMEFPAMQSVREVWCTALPRCGADPQIGRKLACWFTEAGMDCDVYLSDRLEAGDDRRYDFLLELPLTDGERQIVQCARESHGKDVASLVHLPFFFIHARNPTRPSDH